MASNIPAMSDCEHVANTQQDTASIVLLLQMHAMSARLQVPKLLPKHVCCDFVSYHSPVAIVNYSQHISGSDQEDFGPEL
jgi:hypothetical protein